MLKIEMTNAVKPIKPKTNFAKLKRKKVLQRGGKSKYVYLMEKKIIKKAYDRKNKDQLFRLKREVQLMRHLRYCPFVPKLLHVDWKDGSIYMQYVGTPLTNTKENQRALQQKMKELHLDWNVMRHRKGKPNYSVYIGNGTRMNGQVYVIDFGSLHYRVVGPMIRR
jgi:predicted Ser/Thr protein kinase